MRIAFNAPFVLTFTFASAAAGLAIFLTDGAAQVRFFSIYAPFQWQEPMQYVRLLGHVMGHANWAHFAGNFSLILLIGPLVESSFGSFKLMLMTIVTAIATGLIHIFTSEAGLMGASGVAFMIMVAGSFANNRKGYIPLTFILVFTIYLGNEIIRIFENDHISQLAHIIGGLCGAAFGFLWQDKQKPVSVKVKS